MTPLAGGTDCLIVGGGPAGLTAAIYLARFHLSVRLVDSCQSRAALIPLTRNHAGYPEGISGTDLLSRMREQALRYGVLYEEGEVTRLSRETDGFRADIAGRPVRARTVLLATGVVNRPPPMLDERSHDQALKDGRLRYCPICDGYEVTDLAVAVLGTGRRGCNEALFLRGYSTNVTLVASEEGHQLEADHLAALSAAGVTIAERCNAIRLADQWIELEIDNEPHRFDTLYPALGSDVRSELAAAIGASVTEDGCLVVDRHQRTDIEGIYGAGDVVLGLDQISHAMGEGGVAATTIRNDLAKATPILR